MIEFFQSMDAKMAAFFKRKLRQVTPIQGAVKPEDVGSPLFLAFGSITNCTMADAMANARAQAETYVSSPEIAYYRVYEDGFTGRFVYEVREGGPENSIIEKVLDKLQMGDKVAISLTNGAVAVIQEVNQEIFTLVYKSEEELQLSQENALSVDDLTVAPVHIETLMGSERIKEVYPVQKGWEHAGGIILGVAISLFVLSGAVYVALTSGALDGDALMRQTKIGQITDGADNPVWQLDKARSIADKEGKVVRVLKKGPNGWSWELEK